MTNAPSRISGALSQATHIEVDAGVRYWEDATVDGVEDTDGKLIPGRQRDDWKVRINLTTGIIEGWPGVTADIHYKVCDAGLYWLTDSHGKRIAKWRGQYVPDEFLCHGDHGYGDYIIMKVSNSGQIDAFKSPEICPENWSLLSECE